MCATANRRVFRGTALQPVPQGQRADWAWGVGASRCGIGVPFLACRAKCCAIVGQPSFPDRVTLVALFAIVMSTALAFEDVDALTRVTIQAVIGFADVRRAVATRLFVYEEAVAYAYLWAALQFVLIAGAERL